MPQASPDSVLFSSSFDAGTDGWAVYNAGTLANDNGRLKFSGAYPWCTVKKELHLNAGKQYHVRFTIDMGNCNELHLPIYKADISGYQFLTGGVGEAVTTSGTYEGTFTAMANEMLLLFEIIPGVNPPPDSTGYFWLDNVSMEEVKPGDSTHFDKGGYRYGFNGKELDQDPVQYDYGFRIYDPRLGRFKSVDPLTPKYPELTPYQFASNTPIWGIDRDGKEFQVNNWLWNIWMDWEFGDPAGIKTLKSGLEEKASIQSHQMSYDNEHVPKGVQSTLDIVHNADANSKIAAGTSKLIAFNVKTSAEVVSNIVPIGEGAELIFRGGSEAGVIDIALGLKNGEQLPEFAKLVRASHSDQWAKMDLYSKDVTNFPDAFNQAVGKVLESGGKIKFDITNLDLIKAAKAQSKSLYDEGVGYTDWEFGQVTGNSKLLRSTEFYENGKIVESSEVLKRAGIKK